MNNYPLTTSSYRESLEKEKAEFLKHFTKKDWKNSECKKSLILKMQQFHHREQYAFSHKTIRRVRFFLGIGMKSIGLVALFFPLFIITF